MKSRLGAHLGPFNQRVVQVNSEGYEVDPDAPTIIEDLDGIADWTEQSMVQCGPAHITKAGVEGQSHYVCGISASFDREMVGLLTLKDGAKIKGTWFVHSQRDIDFSRPMKYEVDCGIELTLVPAFDIEEVEDNKVKKSKDTVYRAAVVMTGKTR